MFYFIFHVCCPPEMNVWYFNLLLMIITNCQYKFQWIKGQSWASILPHGIALAAQKISTRSQANMQKLTALLTNHLHVQDISRWFVHQTESFFLIHPFSYFYGIAVPDRSVFKKGKGDQTKKLPAPTTWNDSWILITTNLTQISQKFFFQVHGDFTTFVPRILTVTYLKNLNIMNNVHIRRSNWKDCRMSNEIRIRISNFHPSYLRCCIAKIFYETKHVIILELIFFCIQIVIRNAIGRNRTKKNNLLHCFPLSRAISKNYSSSLRHHYIYYTTLNIFSMSFSKSSTYMNNNF